MHCRTYVPNQMLQGDKFKITVYGFVGTYRITTIQRTIITLNSGYTTDISPIDESTDTDFFSQITEEIEEINSTLLLKSDLGHTHTTEDITDFPTLANVASSGSYNDLTNKPSIPSKTSQLQNDSGFLTQHQSLDDYVQKSQTEGLLRNDGSVDENSYALSSHDHTGTYAPNSHNHTKSDITDFPSIPSDVSDLEDSTGIIPTDVSDLTDNTGIIPDNIFSGSYNDLTDKPNIPSKISDLTDDSDFIEKSSTEGLIKNDGSVDTTAYSTFDGNYNNLSNKPSIPSDVSDLTDTQNTQFTPKSHTHSEYVNPVIVDDLTTDDSSKVLSAKQGKALKGLVDGKASSSHNHTKSDITDFSHDHDDRYYTETEINGLLDDKLDASDAFSGSYNDLSNKPSIPSKTSDLTNDSGYLTSHQDITGKLDKAQTSYKGKNVVVDGTSGNISFEEKNDHTHSQYLTEHQSLANYIQKNNTQGLIKSDGTVDTNNYLTQHQSLTGYLQTTDVVDSLTSTSTTAPLSAAQGKALKDLIGNAILYINGSDNS